MPLLAQNDLELKPCGSDIGISPWLRDFQSRIDDVPRNDDILYLPVQVHVIGTDEGSGYLSRKGVLDAFCTLNADFEQVNIQFFMPNPISYLNNSAYYDHTYNQGYEMMDENNLPNVINCYIVDSPAGNCGYFSRSYDGIALAKNCVQPNDHTWSHEVGHFLSIPHPFSGWEGVDDHDYSTPAPNNWGNRTVERVDGSNCTTAGDGFCDTPPDYLNYTWPCDAAGVSLVQQTDPNGETFFSDASLFMSYAVDTCPYRFSDDQIAAMRANVEEVRTNLITIPPVIDDIVIESPEEMTVLSPEADLVVETPSITLEWEPVPNATHYILQINPFNIFTIVFEEQVVEGSSALVTDLEGDETYYWRIRPYNEYETCTDFTEPASFNTGTIVSTSDLSANEVFDLFPNPVTNGELQLNIRLEEASAMSWRMMDATGSLLQKEDLGSSTGLQRINLPVANLPAGVYFVQILTADRQLVRKVLVQ